MESPMSPLEEFKPSMCLSPQDKLKSSSGLLAQRAAAASKKDVAATAAALLDAAAATTTSDLDSGWVSDDYLRAMDFDDCLAQDIDWVDSSFGFASTSAGVDDDDVVSDFGFSAAAAYLSPLRSELQLPLSDDEVSSSFDCSSVRLEPLDAPDAEKLLMSFDTMRHFTIPSPTSRSASKRKRASLFARPLPEVVSKAARVTAAAGGCMSPSLKLKVAARACNELLAAASTDIDKAASDPMLGVLNIAAPLASAAVNASVSAVAMADDSSCSGNVAAKKTIGSYSPEARRLRIQQFHEKRKRRTWKKSIKYDCRKKLADDRPRIKGRFVRVLDDSADNGGAMSPASVGFTPPVTPVASPLAPLADAFAVAVAAASPASTGSALVGSVGSVGVADTVGDALRDDGGAAAAGCVVAAAAVVVVGLDASSARLAHTVVDC